MRVLNEQPKSDNGEPQTALALAASLQRQLLSLQGTYLQEDGSGVDYKALAKSQEFKAYQALACQLQKVDISTLHREDDRRCFFINLYNALTVHGIASADWDNKPPSSVLDIPDFWSTTAYQIGEHIFTLDDIEHGILRDNGPHPKPGAERMFASDDARLSLKVPLDPRVHFALVCGAKSCPPIRVFHLSNLDRGLKAAATNFCDSEVSVDSQTEVVTLSKIMDWYSLDFGNTQHEVLAKIASYLSPGPTKDALNQILEKPAPALWYLRPRQVAQLWRLAARVLFNSQSMLPGAVEVRFKKYNWSLNQKAM